MAMIAMLRYCRRRKARAPCWIAAVISRIRSLPVSLRRTSLVRRPANPRPAKIAKGMTMLRSICAIASSPSPDPRRNFLRVLGLDGLTRHTSERGSKGRAGGSSRPVPGPGRGTRGHAPFVERRDAVHADPLPEDREGDRVPGVLL